MEDMQMRGEGTQATEAKILGRLISKILKGLPAAEAARWRRRFEGAAPEGADLSGVVRRFLSALLTDPAHGAVKLAKGRPEAEGAILAVVELYRRALSGDRPAGTEWAEAAQAVEAAVMVRTASEDAALEAAAQTAGWAATAVSSAAWAEASAWTAWAAAWAAEERAKAVERAAEAAAWATRSAEAEADALADHYRWQAGLLLRLLPEVPEGHATCSDCQGSGRSSAHERLSEIVRLLLTSADDVRTGRCSRAFGNPSAFVLTSNRVVSDDMTELTAGLSGCAPDVTAHNNIDRVCATDAIVAAAGLPETWGTCPICGGTGTSRPSNG